MLAPTLFALVLIESAIALVLVLPWFTSPKILLIDFLDRQKWAQSAANFVGTLFFLIFILFLGTFK